MRNGINRHILFYNIDPPERVLFYNIDPLERVLFYNIDPQNVRGTHFNDRPTGEASTVLLEPTQWHHFRNRFYKTSFRPKNFSDKILPQNLGQISNKKHVLI
jgi:hypothetical protein